MPVSANKRLTAALLLLAAVSPAVADVLSELPEALQEKLLPVEEIALDDLDNDSRQQIDSVRKRVAAAIDRQGSDPARKGAADATRLPGSHPAAGRYPART